MDSPLAQCGGLIMAIYLYSGTPGSGKSLHSAKDIIDWFKKGKPVISNFDVDLSPYPKAKHTCVEDLDLTPEFLAEFSRNFFGGRKLTKKDEDTILLVIDECQLMFNSREYQKKDRKIWIKFFTMHRKLGYRVILIAQMDKMLDKQIRGVIEYEYIHRKLSNFGKAGKILTLFFGGETFTAVQMWYPLKLKIGSSFFKCKKKYYKLYDSYVTFGEKKSLSCNDNSEQQPAQETLAPTAALPALDPEPEVKQGEVIQDKPKKRKKRPAVISGTYVRPWTGRSLISVQGKYLRPGGRNETGWTKAQRKNA